jgi:hypothetical protein
MVKSPEAIAAAIAPMAFASIFGCFQMGHLENQWPVFSGWQNAVETQTERGQIPAFPEFYPPCGLTPSPRRQAGPLPRVWLGCECREDDRAGCQTDLARKAFPAAFFAVLSAYVI